MTYIPSHNIPRKTRENRNCLYLEIDLDAVNQEEDDDNKHQQGVATVEHVREEALQKFVKSISNARWAFNSLGEFNSIT